MSRDFDGVVPILLAISFATTFGPHHIIAHILPYINRNRGSWSRAVSIIAGGFFVESPEALIVA
jgi:hypothetical protein